MREGVRLGRVAGIPVSARWSVVVILGLISWVLAAGVLPLAAPGLRDWVYWAMSVPASLLFVGCLLAHEFAHCVLARRHGVGVKAIRLFALGGVSELSDEPPDPRSDFLIAVAGPLTSLALGVLLGCAGVGSAVLGGPAALSAVLLWLSMINVFLAVFNLLPGAPLDGGRVLRAFLWSRSRDRDRAAESAARAGIGLGYALAAVGLAEAFLGDPGGFWLVLVGWFLAVMAKMETVSAQIRRRLRGVRVGDVMETRFDVLPAWSPAGECAERISGRPAEFMVVEPDGHPVGVVNAGLFAHLRPELRALPVRAAMVPLPERNITAPDAPAASLFSAPPPDGVLVAAVVDAGRPVGLVTTGDLDRALRRLPQASPPAVGDGRDSAERSRRVTG
ncbi:site-2 protease family protein [Actinocorallia aurea]